VNSADLDLAFANVEEGQIAKRKVAQQPRPGENILDTDLTVALVVEDMNRTRGLAGVGPLDPELVPERVAVAWLKDKVRVFRRQLATEGLTPDQQRRLDAFKAALEQRGWTEV
jgi:hypothetical protein